MSPSFAPFRSLYCSLPLARSLYCSRVPIGYRSEQVEKAKAATHTHTHTHNTREEKKKKSKRKPETKQTQHTPVASRSSSSSSGGMPQGAKPSGKTPTDTVQDDGRTTISSSSSSRQHWQRFCRVAFLAFFSAFFFLVCARSTHIRTRPCLCHSFAARVAECVCC